jgi:hypothetical protein
MRVEKTAAESQRGKHIQQKSPCGPTTTPRSPSASTAYSRSACGASWIHPAADELLAVTVPA